MRLIGIEDSDLQRLITDAYKRGYQEATTELQGDGEWLNSREEICAFLSPSKPISVSTFNRNRLAGVYGEAIIGKGARCRAKKQDILDAIYLFESNK